MTRLSLSSRSHSRKRDRYRSISTLDRSADSFRNNGRINSPEARDRSYRDRSVRKSKWNRGRRKRKTKRIQSRFYFSLPLEEMLNFTVKFNESMDRFGRKTDGCRANNPRQISSRPLYPREEDTRIALFSPFSEAYSLSKPSLGVL